MVISYLKKRNDKITIDFIVSVSALFKKRQGDLSPCLFLVYVKNHNSMISA
jgi:hypothetical protein